jgi:hypothetical protein
LAAAIVPLPRNLAAGAGRDRVELGAAASPHCTADAAASRRTAAAGLQDGRISPPPPPPPADKPGSVIRVRGVLHTRPSAAKIADPPGGLVFEDPLVKNVSNFEAKEAKPSHPQLGKPDGALHRRCAKLLAVPADVCQRAQGTRAAAALAAPHGSRTVSGKFLRACPRS